MPVSSSSMKNEVLFDFVLHRPGRQNRDRHEEGREQNQKQTDAVDADEIFDAEARHPGDTLDELHFAFAGNRRNRRNFDRPEKGRAAASKQRVKARRRCRGNSTRTTAPITGMAGSRLNISRRIPGMITVDRDNSQQRQGADEKAGQIVLDIAGLRPRQIRLKPLAVPATPLTKPSMTPRSKT